MVPWPPVILAIISLPQKIPQVTRPPRISKMTRIIIRMMRRTLCGFLVFLGFWVFDCSRDSLDFSGAASGFSDSSGSISKFNASTGERKSLIGAVLRSTGFWLRSLALKSSSTSIFRESSRKMSVFSGTFLRSTGFWLRFVFFVLAFGREILDAEFLASRVISPSIDLFGFIIYNYSIMAIKLTKKQLAVLEFIQDFTEERGISPSYREIQAGLELASVSAVAEHIYNLVAKGVLKKVDGAARSLEILDYKHEETVELFRMKMLDCTDEEKAVLEKAMEILNL